MALFDGGKDKKAAEEAKKVAEAATRSAQISKAQAKLALDKVSQEAARADKAEKERTTFATTGGSTGIAIGTDGALLTVVAKKLFLATSESDGDIDLTWTDTGTEAAYLGVLLPNGTIEISDAMTNT